jgi:hypothetical protein
MGHLIIIYVKTKNKYVISDDPENYTKSIIVFK